MCLATFHHWPHWICLRLSQCQLQHPLMETDVCRDRYMCFLLSSFRELKKCWMTPITVPRPGWGSWTCDTIRIQIHISVRQLVNSESSTTIVHLKTADILQDCLGTCSLRSACSAYSLCKPKICKRRRWLAQILNFCEAFPDEDLSWGGLPCRGNEPNFHSSWEPTSLPTRQAQVTERTHSEMERMEKERQMLNDEGNLIVENCGQRGRKGDRLCGHMKQK